MPPDPNALEAIRRFETRQAGISPKTSKVNNSVLHQRKHFGWKVPLGIAMLGATLVSIVIVSAEYLVGQPWRVLYTKTMARQIEWTESRHPVLAPALSVLKLPLLHELPAEPLLLYARDEADAHDPSFQKTIKLPERSLAGFVTMAHEGGTVLLPPGRYPDCAVITQSVLTIRAEVQGQAQLDGGACQGKAALVAHGNDLTVDGLVFKNIHVPDGNGAGIRHETGSLTVRNSIFYNSENGILTTTDNDLDLTIDKSLFLHLGGCKFSGGCSHSIYSGAIGKLTITNSIFRNSAGGHFLKSRAHSVHVSGNTFDDAEGVSSCHVELPYGANGEIQNNLFIKGIKARSRFCFVKVGAEGARNDSSQLYINGNTAESKTPVSVFVQNKTSALLYVKDNTTKGFMITATGKTRG